MTQWWRVLSYPVSFLLVAVLTVLCPADTYAVETCPLEGARLYPADSQVTYMVHTDVDGDGNEDLILHENNNGITVALGDGTGGFEPAGYTPVYGIARGDLTLADFNGDGRPDVAACSYGVQILLHDGDHSYELG